MHTLIMMASVLVASCAHGQSPIVSCRLQDQYALSSDQHPSGDQHPGGAQHPGADQHSSGDQHPAADPHSSGVDSRGDHAMGFSHESTVHHFVPLPDGGIIAVETTAENDTATRDQIRIHLGHIAQLFKSGDFDIPMTIHDRVPPGVPVMKAKRDTICYKYLATKRGGEVRIRTSDSDALKAVHEFLVFQIQDHRTSDPIKN